MTGSFVVSADHPCLPDHFPGRPIVPAVVILEHVLDCAEAAGHEVVAVASARLLQPLVPGRRCEVHLRQGTARLRFRVTATDGEEVARGELEVADDGEGPACG